MSNAVAFLVMAVPLTALGGAVIWWLEVVEFRPRQRELDARRDAHAPERAALDRRVARYIEREGRA